MNDGKNGLWCLAPSADAKKENHWLLHHITVDRVMPSVGEVPASSGLISDGGWKINLIRKKNESQANKLHSEKKYQFLFFVISIVFLTFNFCFLNYSWGLLDSGGW